MSTGFVIVTKEEFFAAIGPRDIVLRTEPEYTEWETRSRVVVGRTTPGYRNGWGLEGQTPSVYMLVPSAARAALPHP